MTSRMGNTPLIGPLSSEIEAISNLLMTQHCISKLQLPDSLCYLYKCKSEIDSWKYRYVQHEDVRHHPFTPLSQRLSAFHVSFRPRPEHLLFPAPAPAFPFYPYAPISIPTC